MAFLAALAAGAVVMLLATAGNEFVAPYATGKVPDKPLSNSKKLFRKEPLQKQFVR